MNKNLLIKSTLAVAVAATTATAIADVTLYGRYRGGLVATDNGNGVENTSLQNGSSRFGIKAKAPISDSLTAFGRYEFGVNLDEGSLSNGEDTNRLAYVGLKGGFGQIAIGSQWSPFYNVIGSPVDPFQMSGGGTASDFVGYTNKFRIGDAITYSNKFGGFGVEVLIEADDSSEENGNDDDFMDRGQIGLSGSFGPVNVGVAYDTVTDGDDTIGVHLGGKFGPAKVGVSYMTTDTATGDDAGLLAHVGFGFGSGMGIDIGIGQLMPDSGPEASSIGLEFSHKLSKSFRWFAGTQVTDHDTAGQDDSTRTAVGMRLEF